MSTTVCVPVSADGSITHRLGQAPAVAICRVHEGAVTDWTMHAVEWDTTYGVDVLGVHHPRVVRFMRDHEVDTIVADDVCDAVQRALSTLGMSVRTGNRGDARSVVAAFAA